jgi:DNA-binding beta-propeller fold protein YncE
MLRVSRDGKEVWVQTSVANTNVVLAADDLAELATESTGKGPVTNAWTPDGRYSIITNTGDTYASVFDAKTYREVKRLEIGEGGSNIGFSGDGATAFITVPRANAVAVVEMTGLEVIEQVPVGTQPTGLIVL